MARALALLALVGATSSVLAADTTTLKVLLPADSGNLVASIINVGKDATTFAIACAEGSDDDECPIPGAQTMTQGPSTWVWNYIYSDESSGVFTQNLSCKLDPKKDIATCDAKVTQTVAGVPFTTSDSTVTSGYISDLAVVTVTAGAGKLTAAPGATETTLVTSTTAAPGSSSAATETGSATETASNTSAGQSSSSGASSSAPSSTKSDNAAKPINTNNAIFAGIAAVVGGVMMI